MRDSRAAVAHEQSVGEGPKIIRGFPRRTCGVEGEAQVLIEGGPRNHQRVPKEDLQGGGQGTGVVCSVKVLGEGPKIIRGFPRRTCGVEGKAGTLWALMK